ncbi:hypothetical protein [Nevskia sp.]|uniref:hypothetical protein n=1 Tax=Nevskia sp. TaxID=1929292 RepID=UPI003F72D79B
MNFYIVTFDRQVGVSYKPFHEAFTKHVNFRRWWHYIQSSYLIGTELSEAEVSEHFVNTAKSLNMRATHLVLKVDLKRRQGMLPKDAWEWFKKNA